MDSFLNDWPNCGVSLETHGPICFIHIGFSILNEYKSQIIFGPSSQNAWECEKIKNINMIVHERKIYWP